MKLIVFISGFSQTTKKVNGVSERFKWAYNARRAAGANEYRVELYTWRANWEAVAEYCRSTLEVSAVDIISYSWGVGHGAMQLAKHLQQRDIVVPWLISCDGVYRGWGIESVSRANPLNWRSLIHRGPLAPKIKVPGNVLEVFPLRQPDGKLHGHDFKIIAPTVLNDTQWLTLDHSEMDDSPEFESLVKRKLTELWED